MWQSGDEAIGRDTSKVVNLIDYRLLAQSHSFSISLSQSGSLVKVILNKLSDNITKLKVDSPPILRSVSFGWEDLGCLQVVHSLIPGVQAKGKSKDQSQWVSRPVSRSISQKKVCQLDNVAIRWWGNRPRYKQGSQSDRLSVAGPIT